MFLDLIRRRNPALIEQAIALHQAGRLPANSYVIDLDAVEVNARGLAGAASALGLKTYAMTKQMARHPAYCRAIAQGGITKAVAVDMECGRAAHRGGLAVGHIGHLVQIPRHEANAAASLAPDHWTAFNIEKATEAGAAAHRLGRTQAILARIAAEGDQFYRGHEGGFPADDIVAVANAIDALPGARFAGITTFPSQLFDHASRTVKPTPNLVTLQRAADALARAGRTSVEINTPGTISAAILPMLASAGSTQVEPGHGLTGTTPLHLHEDLEVPAVIYLSEVSHVAGGEAFCFGGGLYVDPVFPEYVVRAVVASRPTVADDALRPVALPARASIDYYGMIDATGPMRPKVGDSVVFGFRPQAFVTRAYVAGISGLSTGNPALAAICDSYGRPVDWPI